MIDFYLNNIFLLVLHEITQSRLRDMYNYCQYAKIFHFLEICATSMTMNDSKNATNNIA